MQSGCITTLRLDTLLSCLWRNTWSTCIGPTRRFLTLICPRSTCCSAPPLFHSYYSSASLFFKSSLLGVTHSRNNDTGAPGCFCGVSAQILQLWGSYGFSILTPVIYVLLLACIHTCEDRCSPVSPQMFSGSECWVEEGKEPGCRTIDPNRGRRKGAESIWIRIFALFITSVLWCRPECQLL